jgi:hypothetical protein
MLCNAQFAGEDLSFSDHELALKVSGASRSDGPISRWPDLPI